MKKLIVLVLLDVGFPALPQTPKMLQNLDKNGVSDSGVRPSRVFDPK